ncbi:hypothetical protein B0T17DRAFT_539581 [Bombardia bombarda]|uniref:Uncharacterized protein n=1 Tax=Bombardia bombarda TaxID=252184 RepID=A0AA39WI99_9PEZI|nr:hypothetical protein B0T17DRAFT_539581 [Bombardia bombarda]
MERGQTECPWGLCISFLFIYIFLVFLLPGRFLLLLGYLCGHDLGYAVLCICTRLWRFIIPAVFFCFSFVSSFLAYLRAFWVLMFSKAGGEQA